LNAITKTDPRPVLMPQTFDQLVRFAELAANTDMVPKDFKGKPGNIMLAVQMGSELGLSPMQSLSSIAVINGRPGVWGDGLIGLCRQSPLCQDIVETITGEGDARTATCTATRRGSTPVTAQFSAADAKKAGLWGKSIWAQYPDRMLQNRARGFALRDAFPDLLRGLKTAEELRDTPADDFKGTTIEAAPAPHTDAYAAPRQPTPAQPERKRTVREIVRDKLVGCTTEDEVQAVAALPLVTRALAEAPSDVREEIGALLADALTRVLADPDAAHEPVTEDVA
jgi:hypothetical protein